jgi:hypothetical protein
MVARHSLVWRALLLAGTLHALTTASCQRATPDRQDAAAGESASPAKREIWDALFLEGSKIGYSHTSIRPVQDTGKSLVATDVVNHLSLRRFGQTVEQDLKIGTVETPEGELLRFTTEAALGPTPVRFKGHVEAGEMVIEGNGATKPVRMPWSKDVRGFRGLEESLEKQPMAPNSRRQLKVLVPLVNQVADVELKAGQKESTAVMGKPVQLLRIEAASKLPDGQVMEETIWTDERGDVVKRHIAAMKQESHRTSRELATSESATPATFDLGTGTIVKLDRPLTEGHETRRVRYRLEMEGGNPAELFAPGATQTVRSLGPHAAELTVEAVRPAEAKTARASTTDPQYLRANEMLQIHDPRIQEMAREAKGAAPSRWEVAVNLERYVHRIVKTKDFSQTFASAADVAESRQGDCTEHAVLLAALARACGIPARVAIGLVYLPRAQGFGYHMWTEVEIDGRWLPLDATLGQGGIGAAHIKLTDSSLDGASAYSMFLPVAQVVGQLKISVLDAE